MRISDWSSDVCSSDLADVMRAGGGAIAGRRRKRKFELAWQPVEFRMERRPLPGDLAIRTWIDKLIVRDAGEMIRGHIANRSKKQRGGKEGVRTVLSRGAPYY